MNFMEFSKLIMKGEKIYNLPLKVCFYARVSTESDNQLNSLENQRNYYENYIKSKPNWTYVDGYIDEGISGVRVEKRYGFKKMIEDAKKHKFDLIITKEVSRFARDIEDSIHYIRILKDANVGIYFENQNLNTFDTNSELILNIMFNLAQDESRKLSSRVKFGHREAIKKGHVLGSSNIIGYKKSNCKLIIVEKEAELIRKIFELYATGNYGFYKLSKKLGELGFYNKNCNLYDKDTLKRIIENPKYKGFYRARTYEILDYRTKKRKKNKKEEQIIYKCEDGSVPAIVSEEIWNKANDILNSRIQGYKNNNHWTGGVKYPFSSKLYCQEHNKSFQRSHGNGKSKRPTWSCGNYLQYRLDACVSPIIAEKDLYNIFLQIMDHIILDKNMIIDSMLKLYEIIYKTNQYESELGTIDEQIKLIEDKKSKTLDLIFNGTLKKEELKVQFEHFEENIKSLKLTRQKISEQMNILNQNKSDVKKLKESIEDEVNGGVLEEFIRKFTDEIIVSKIDKNRYDIQLDIYLNLFAKVLIKTKGARHLESVDSNSMPYLLNQKYSSTESLQINRQRNNFTYNIYLEIL